MLDWASGFFEYRIQSKGKGGGKTMDRERQERENMCALTDDPVWYRYEKEVAL